ncbi:MAG: hypothetical protein ACRD6X_20750 [Pyrinomonadaceae bacterium]
MNAKNPIIRIIGVVGVLSLTAIATNAQAAKPKTYKLWSPPDHSFTIEVPKKLKEFEGYSQVDQPNAVKSYGVQKQKRAFIVYILKFKDYETKSTEDKFGGLFFMIGGDDDWEFTEQNRIVDGFSAQQIVYKNQNKKGLFIDAGNMVIVLGFTAEERAELSSPEVIRFFNSFRLDRDAKNGI